jgi:hypothetical protein
MLRGLEGPRGWHQSHGRHVRTRPTLELTAPFLGTRGIVPASPAIPPATPSEIRLDEMLGRFQHPRTPSARASRRSPKEPGLEGVAMKNLVVTVIAIAAAVLCIRLAHLVPGVLPPAQN